MTRKKISISNILITLLFSIILIVLFGVISSINSIKKYVGNDALVINRLGQIRGSMQRMSKLMIAKRDYSKVQKVIENAFNDIDTKYLSNKLTKKYQHRVGFDKKYNELKNYWIKLKNSKGVNNIISISEKCWNLADKTTTSAQKIAEIKENALICSVETTTITVILFIGIGILIVYFLVKKGLEKDRITDELTTLFNRYYLEEQMKYHIELYNRYGLKFSTIFFDIDFFKKVNDTFGHEKGDDVLFEIANIVKKELRDVDFAFRYGGEEFIILLPEIDLTKAIKIAERLRKTIENNKFSVDKKITVSIGVAEYQKGESEKDFISRVDSYTYKAKQNGRNIVVWK
jgi:diguanylate cyclase (GGDEF)-like protein